MLFRSKAEEMMEIADALGITFEQSFMLPDGEKVGLF